MPAALSPIPGFFEMVWSRMPDEWTHQVYEELRQLARRQFRRERPGHTLQPTALVNEAWLRMRGRGDDWASRAHFFLAASTAMRRILVDHARHRGRAVRGGGIQRVTLRDVDLMVEFDLVDLLALDEALDRLAAEDERAAKAVQLRYLVGRTADEIAELLGISAPTVWRDLDFATRFLGHLLRDHGRTEDHEAGGSG